MTYDELNVNREPTIRRCPHDKENPYAQISRLLIRDDSISPNCRWLIIYLLSMKDGWKISIKNLINHVKPHFGRDKFYKILDEAIAAGYMKKEVFKKSGKFHHTEYFVSEEPRFKKCSPHPCFPDAASSDSVDTDAKEYTYPFSKEEQYKEITISPPIPPHSEPEKQAAIADAPCVAVKSLDNFSKKVSKKTKISGVWDPHILEITQKMIAILVKHKPNYLIPSNLAPIHSHVDQMINIDMRDAKSVIDVFQWAVADHFWTDKMYCKNPAKYFRDRFEQLEKRMQTKPPEQNRKFAPSSDQEACARGWEKFTADAL